MKYVESQEKSKEFKEGYVNGFYALINELQEEADKGRAEYAKNIFDEPEKYREDFRKILGWPLTGYVEKEIPTVRSEKLSDEDEYTIYRMHIDILPKLTLTGLFYKQKGDGKKPLVIAQHGALGTPELISGFCENGYTHNYNDMLLRIVDKGVHVFAPQLLLWNADKYGVKYSRELIDSRLKDFGGSVTAVEIHGIMRVLDYFETQDYVGNFGMVGLSYGGFFTLYTTALDTRIKSAISCSFFSRHERNPRCDWGFFGIANKFNDAEIACLAYPRHLCLQMGKDDFFWDSKYTLTAFDELKSYCKKVGTNWVDLIMFEGTHEFYKGDEPIERLVKDIK